MRFLTEAECAIWCERSKLPLNDSRKPTRDFLEAHQLQCRFPQSFTQLLWFSRVIESALQPRDTCLLWVTDWNIFPSNENNHLYYKYRQSYGEVRLLDEAPGHLCLDYEDAEVITLIHLSILFGWDLHLIPTSGYARAFVCHDEWVALGFDDQSELDQKRKQLQEGNVQIL